MLEKSPKVLFVNSEHLFKNFGKTLTTLCVCALEY